MGPTRKSRSVNKRFSNIREAASSKDKGAPNTGKNRQKASPGIQKKRKLADMLGPQWSKEELECFYEAYREHGKDWKKVALAVRNRTMEMVEALYTMNRAYLSLPEGTASVVGLIAMMTDHYSILGGSDSGKDSNGDAEISKKSKKRPRGKQSDNKAVDEHFSGHSQPHSVASDDGCLSLLKKRHSGIRPHAVRKRTPRVPISYSIGKDNGGKFFSSARQDSKQMADTNDVTHKIALALAEASQRGGSSKNIGSSNKKNMPSPNLKIGKKHVKLEIVGAKFGNSNMDGSSSELSLGSTEGDNGEYSRKLIYRRSRENTGRERNQEKGIKHYRKNLKPEENMNKHLNDLKEASSGTDGGKHQSSFKSNFDIDFPNAKSARSSYKGPRKKSKKLLFEKDESSAFDALKTLADLSLMMPTTNPDTESSVQFNEGKYNMVDESKMETDNGNSFRKSGKVFSDKGAAAPKAEGAYQLNAGSRKRKQKSTTLKIDETHTGSHISDSQKIKVTDEVKKSLVKGKRSSVSTAHSRQLKMVLSTSQVGQVSRDRPRRKMEKPRPMVQKDHRVSEKSIASYWSNSIERHKGKLNNCLSSYQMRRWCTSEWFYSAIDYPWFSKREFVEYLDHVGLGHVPRLTRIEWGVIRSSLGRPRRFSEQFLIEEKHKLNQYRESVRSHYAEVLAGTKEGLPADLAQPLIVGQRVIAIHPKTREIHDGSILTVDHCRYRVQFDQHELGVEFVMDIDCMPLYPSENMPMSLIRHHISPARINGNLSELTHNGKISHRKISEHTILSPSENSDAIKGRCVPPALHGFSSSCKSQANVAGSEICNGQSVSTSQSSFLERVHSKEADILAISELTRALEKKELVLSELKHMNDGVSESQKCGDNSVKDSEPFKRNYASVLKQLTEANEQVSSGLFCLRQRNAYQASSSVLSLKPMANVDDPGGQASSSNCSACHNQESRSQNHIAEIVESSRRKARTMVVQATQAMSVFTKTESKVERIEDAINFINNRISVDDPTASVTSSLPVDSITLASRDQLNASSTLNILARCHVQDDELNSTSDQNEMKIPSELISHCLATLLMIQKCTERQFPPADVAQISQNDSEFLGIHKTLVRG
ncbi:unnamed protein product [Lathyrus oleraceus]